MNAIDILSIPKLDDLINDIDAIEAGQLAFDDTVIRYKKGLACFSCALGHTSGNRRCSLSDVMFCSGDYGWETVDTNSL